MLLCKSRFTGTLLIIILLLLCFNGYYFFLRRSVGLSYYFFSLLSAPQDSILDAATYLMMREEYDALNNTQPKRQYAVFIGDSITRRFMLDEYFPGQRVLNRGIFSDTTTGCLARLEKNINLLLPRKTFIMIGHNDLQYRENRQIFENIKKIVTSLEGGEKYLQSILPVYGEPSGRNRRIVSLNNRLEKFCINSKECTYVNLHRYFVNRAGSLDRKYSLDGVHLNRAGYEVWAGLIFNKIK